MEILAVYLLGYFIYFCVSFYIIAKGTRDKVSNSRWEWDKEDYKAEFVWNITISLCAGLFWPVSIILVGLYKVFKKIVIK